MNKGDFVNKFSGLPHNEFEAIAEELYRGENKLSDVDVKNLDQWIRADTYNVYDQFMKTDTYQNATEDQKVDTLASIRSDVRNFYVRGYLRGRGLGDKLPEPSRNVRRMEEGKEPVWRLTGAELTIAEQLSDDLDDARRDLREETDPDLKDNHQRDIQILEVKQRFATRPDTPDYRKDVVTYYGASNIDIINKLNRLIEDQGVEASMGYFNDLVELSVQLFDTGAQSRVNPKFFDSKGRVKIPEDPRGYWALFPPAAGGDGGDAPAKFTVGRKTLSQRSTTSIKPLTAAQVESIFKLRGRYNRR